MIGLSAPASAQQVFPGDVVIQSSLCVGFDCTSGENFGFDTLRLKENNLRIHFDDTSSSGSFPSTDWRISINDTTNGGASYFRVTDVSSARDIFTIGNAAPSNSLVVEQSTGDIGLGTAAPVVELHVADGDSPALRLEQNGSSGFTPQVWDVAGNETNFFVRDVTNGSKLPFRIRPGAPSDALYIDTTGEIGFGTNSPSAPMHMVAEGGQMKLFEPERPAIQVTGETGDAGILIEETNGTATARGLLHLRNNGRVFFGMEDSTITEGPYSGRIWNMQNSGGSYTITTAPGGTNSVEFSLSPQGDLSIAGNFISGATTLNVPDYVFAPEYRLRPLAELRAFIEANSHLPDVPSAAQVGQEGLNLGEMQMTLLRKIEELTLYTLEQDERIAALNAQLATMSSDDAR
ncbi:hypothetical protein [Citreimonas sp.]|uniref:hypothetical protein n=1 Tax=Citreimonas sp. TaxID=3036715 RepID=UPI0035C824FA